jgi:cytochrome c oxidase cbb3-type subunit 3
MAEGGHSHVDPKTGKSTTGHEWDGISELNTPLPRWWLWTFYATILWAFGYWIVYPAWPLVNGATQGLFGWHSRTAVVRELRQLEALRAPATGRLEKASLDDIEKSPELLTIARAQGAALFANNCAPCHGAGGQGAKGYPNLNADRWLWGGTLKEIQTTITHGARWDADADTHSSLMPSFGRDGILKPDQIVATANFVRSLSGLKTEPNANLALGKKTFADNCAACHGPEGKGNKEMGAPNLTTKVWLYGNKLSDIVHRINVGGGGQMPAWGAKLSGEEIKALTVFVHSLGGGQ